VLDEHPSFATSSGFADSTQAFSPEKSASYTPASLTGHIPAINAILSGSDQFLAPHPSGTKEEPVESSDSFSPFAEIGTRSTIQDSPVEPLLYLKEPAIPFGDVGNIEIFKVKLEAK